MPVESIRSDLSPFLSKYTVIRDCIAGEDAVKSRKTDYLPQPDADDTSPENMARYDGYLTRAVFYNVTERTLSGLVGQVFARDPEMSIPDLLTSVADDATGEGVNIVQFAKLTTEYALGFGRAGILIDFPKIDRVITAADVRSGTVRPNFTVYDPSKIINWRTFVRNGKVYLSLVVLKEQYIASDDGFMVTFADQYRVLRLVVEDGDYVYKQSVWRRNAEIEITYPVNSEGKRFSEIPFVFIGSKTNDTTIDKPPMYDLAKLNIAHYRNSADYEESCFITGQPTLVLAGLTESWVKDVLKGQARLGSRGAISLPQGATGELLQAQPNNLPFEAMKHKEKQMVALGAKLVENISVQRTATETNIDYAGEVSILSIVADNVSDGVRAALKFASDFVGTSRDSVEFGLNTEFDLVRLSYQDRQQLIQEMQAEAISFSEVRANLRRAGIVTQDDADAKAEIKAWSVEKDKQTISKQKALAAANPTTQPGSPKA